MDFKIVIEVTDSDPDQNYTADDLKYDLQQFLYDQNLEVSILTVEEIAK